MSHLLDAESLRCFVAAADLLNFRAAASRVGLSPPALSERLRRLEDDIGAQLFIRTTRSVRLSPEGERLVGPAGAAIAAIDACRVVVHEGGPLPYDLTLGTRFELGISWLVPALDVLQQNTEERTIHLHFGDSHELFSRTRRGEIDAAITSARYSGDLEMTALHDEDYVFVGAPSLLDKKPLQKADDAERHNLLDAHPTLPLFRYFLDAAPKSEDWRFAKVESLGTTQAILSRVQAGKGVAVLPRYLASKELGKTLRAILPLRQMRTDAFRLFWRKNHPRAEAIARLADELRALPIA